MRKNLLIHRQAHLSYNSFTSYDDNLSVVFNDLRNQFTIPNHSMTHKAKEVILKMNKQGLYLIRLLFGQMIV